MILTIGLRESIETQPTTLCARWIVTEDEYRRGTIRHGKVFVSLRSLLPSAIVPRVGPAARDW